MVNFAVCERYGIVYDIACSSGKLDRLVSLRLSMLKNVSIFEPIRYISPN